MSDMRSRSKDVRYGSPVAPFDRSEPPRRLHILERSGNARSSERVGSRNTISMMHPSPVPKLNNGSWGIIVWAECSQRMSRIDKVSCCSMPAGESVAIKQLK